MLVHRNVRLIKLLIISLCPSITLLSQNEKWETFKIIYRGKGNLPKIVTKYQKFLNKTDISNLNQYDILTIKL